MASSPSGMFHIDILATSDAVMVKMTASWSSAQQNITIPRGVFIFSSLSTSTTLQRSFHCRAPAFHLLVNNILVISLDITGTYLWKIKKKKKKKKKDNKKTISFLFIVSKYFII